MVIIGVIAWVLFLVWLVSLFYPNQEMHRSSVISFTYHCIWVCLFGGALFIHFRVMADADHAVLALVSDVIAISLGVVRFWLRWRYDPDRHRAEDDEASAQHPHARQP